MARAIAGSAGQPNGPKQNRAKLIQIKLLGFAWFYSSESGLFNGYGKNKKNSLSFHLAAGGLARRGFDPASGKTYSTNF
jgi:hypothetical protein